MRLFLFLAAAALAKTVHALCPLVRTGQIEPHPHAGSPDGLDELRQDVEAQQAPIRKLRRGLEMQKAAGSAR